MNYTRNSSNWNEDVLTWTNFTTENLGPAVRNKTSIKPTLVPNLSDVVYILLVCLPVVVQAAAIFINYCVLAAISKLSVYDLKSKYFIVNALLTDMLLPVGSLIVPVLLVSRVFGLLDVYDDACLDGMIAVFNPLFQYAQSLSSLLLVSDRVYAIVTPLKYHTKAYPTGVAVGMISVLWIVTVGLVAPLFLLAKQLTAETGLCWGLVGAHRDWNNLIRFPFIISVQLLVFGIYVLLFGLVKCRRNPMIERNRSDPKSTKDAVSLALTFFLVHLSSLGLYIPGPLFAVLLRYRFVALDFVTMARLRGALILVYMLNAVFDPLIMAKRIPAIKTKLWQTWGKPLHKSSRHRARMTNEGEDGTVSTDHVSSKNFTSNSLESNP